MLSMSTLSWVATGAAVLIVAVVIGMKIKDKYF
jgi:hypothetical protein